MDEAGGLNLYAACGNDLVNRVDALGLFEFQSTSANGVEISGGGWNGTITKSGGYVTWAVPNIQSSPFFELHGYGGGFSISGSGSMSFTPNSMSASQCSETEAPFAINNIGWGAQFSPPGVWVSAGDVCGISSGTSKLTYTLQGPVAVLTASNESQLSSNLFVSPLCTCFNAKGSINVEITIYQSAAGVAGAAAGAAAALVADVPAFVEWLLQNGEDVEETGSGGSPQPAPP
jgi:hypothetical protein